MKIQSIMICAMAAIALGAGTVYADSCVDIDLALSPTTVAPMDELSVFASVENTGDMAGDILLSVTVAFDGQSYGPFDGTINLAGGETLSKEFAVIVPPSLAGGTLTVTVEATSGPCTDTVVASVEVTGGSPLTGGFDALAGDIASGLGLSEPPTEEETTWGALKSAYAD